LPRFDDRLGTLALLSLTAVAVAVGSKLLRRVPVRLLHKAGGALFLAIAALMLVRVLTAQ